MTTAGHAGGRAESGEREHPVRDKSAALRAALLLISLPSISRLLILATLVAGPMSGDLVLRA